MGNVLASLCRFPLPYLTVPFNIVQPLLFLTLISINIRTNSDTLTATAHHMTSQPPSLISSSLISIDRLSPFPDSTPQPPLLFQLNAIKETTTAQVSLDGFTTHGNTFVGEISESKPGRDHKLNLKYSTAKPSEIFEIQNTFQYGETMSSGTLQSTTESDRDLNLRGNFTHTVNESEKGQSLTMATDNYQRKETSVTEMVPESKHSAPTESAQNASDSYFRSNSKDKNSSYSADNAMALPRDVSNYVSETEPYGAGINSSTAPSDVDVTTPEMPQLHSTSIASDFNEENVYPDKESVTIRVKRSNSLEATQQNSLPSHQNSSFDVTEPFVEWGGVVTTVIYSY